jgi:hypothetical protein
MLDLFVARFPAYPSAPICSNDFPKKPRGMHRMTYYRLLAKAMKAQERSIALVVPLEVV